MKNLIVALALILGSNAHAEEMTETKNVSLISLSGGKLATFKVSVCPETAPVAFDIELKETGEGVSIARLKTLVPKHQCYANTSREITVDLGALMILKAKVLNNKDAALLMRGIPFSLEMQNF